MQSSYNVHIKRIVLILFIILVVGLIAKQVLTPDSFGIYGHYRADAIYDEVNREIRHMTNASCEPCHEYESENLATGFHKKLSCEFCHAPNADHAKNGKKIAVMSVTEKKNINALCLRCHNDSLWARPEKIIKTVRMPEHLKDQEVRLNNVCSQCHYVHAPLKYINRPEKAKKMQETSL